MWTLLILLIALALWLRPPIQTIETCTERGLDAALAAAADQAVIRFQCSGTLLITSAKIIVKPITLDSAGQTIVLDGQLRTAIFHVNRGVTATIKGLRIINGSADAGGGGINNQGDLTIIDSIFSGNRHAVSNFGTLTVINTTFADNRGVGIYNQSKLTITGSTFMGNTHGIDNANGQLVVANSTFVRNRFTLPQGIGAGIANSGTVKVYNSTFSDNEADSGGAIGNHKNGTVTLYNTIVAHSAKGSNCFGPIVDGGHNLQYPGATCGSAIPTSDPKLLTLSSRDQPLQTIGLQPDSPAIGKGDTAVCTGDLVGNVDQQGRKRITPIDEACDIGAVEFNAATLIRWPVPPDHRLPSIGEPG
ncbi:MAG: right-handed parallel beta-helix repeat-containing protein [Anaerolineae bacterium]|nr:right-handed parallel beta-helix repeat-containing protein [Anaerolineae bacterium]